LEEVGWIPIRARDSGNWECGMSEEERPFLVGVGVDEEEGEERQGEMPNVMGNVGVPLSRLDLHTSNFNEDASGRAQCDDVSGGGLSGKAGIILVGFSLL